MKKRVSLLLIATCFGLTTFANAASLNLFGENTDNKVIPNCYLRKEYNYFMNQWTTNEVCNPQVIEVPERTVPNRNTNASAEGNIYLGTSPSYVQKTGVTYVNNTNGFYTGNNNGTSINTWNGYGNATNYLLGSFGGGIGYNGYYNNYYPNSVYWYTPSVWTKYFDPGYYTDYSYDYYYPSYSSYWDNPSNHDYDFGLGFGYSAGLAGYSPSEAVDLYNDYYGTDY